MTTLPACLSALYGDARRRGVVSAVARYRAALWQRDNGTEALPEGKTCLTH